ncbi:hypothetical protein ACTQ3U_02985 [Oscillospiraceae bacterium LCP25S3_F9]
MKKTGKIWVVVLVILLVLTAALGAGAYFIYTSATDLTELNKINKTESDSILEPLVKSIVLGEEQTITDSDINGALSMVINSYNEKLTDSQKKDAFIVKGASIYLTGNNTAKIYAEINYNDIKFVFSANSKIVFNENSEFISFEVSDTKLGSLPIPTEFIMSKLADGIDSINKDFQVKGNKIIIPSEYTFEIMERELTLKITDLNVSDGSATVKTTSAMEFLEGLISDIFSGFFSD